jgi:hypothetical protein
MVLADSTNKHGESSANPPAASLNGECSIYSDECTYILASGSFRLTAFGAMRPLVVWGKENIKSPCSDDRLRLSQLPYIRQISAGGQEGQETDGHASSKPG